VLFVESDPAATAELGVQDYVISTVKAHSLPTALPVLLPLIGPNTVFIPIQAGALSHTVSHLTAPAGMALIEPPLQISASSLKPHFFQLPSGQKF
jgi:hypothetical protein